MQNYADDDGMKNDVASFQSLSSKTTCVIDIFHIVYEHVMKV